MRTFNINEAVAVVSGANRGIGKALVEAILSGGARKVYAGARRPETLADLRERWGERLVPVRLDVTKAEDLEALAETAADANLLVNNAGVAGALGRPILDDEAVDEARHEMEVNYFGVLNLTRALAPALARNGGGAVVNLASVASFVNFPLFQSYSASKAAAHSVTQALRLALAGQGTRVTGVYPGPVDTDMAADVPMEKTSSAEVAEAILEGLRNGAEEIFPDPVAREMGGAFLQDPKGLERNVAAMAAEGAAA